MSEDQINEVIHLRHRLRAMVTCGVRDVDAEQLLERMVHLSRVGSDTDLRFEHARWTAQLAVLGQRRRRQAV